MLDSIVLGHNPFFGVDRLSFSRGNEKFKQFENPERILDVMRFCHELGVEGMMMSTHPRSSEVCGLVEKEKAVAQTWRVYPLVPYIQKYVRGANEKGLINMVLGILSQASPGQKISLMFRGGKGLIGGNVWEALGLLLDVELLPFRKLQMGTVFLHDALTDLALGLELDSVLLFFRDYVEKKYGTRAGLATKNLPLLRERLSRMGWMDAVVMASFNAAGFYMNPDRERCAQALQEPGIDFVAMNTLASGHLAPDEAYSYLARFPHVRSVVVGVSHREHARETFESIRRHLFPGGIYRAAQTAEM